ERDDLVAVSVGGKRHHGELDLLAELELGRVVLGQPALDSDYRVFSQTQLDQADAERHEIVPGRAGVGSSGREALGSPCHQGSAARQQQLTHLTATAARTPLLHWEGGGATVAASTADQLRAVIGPGGDVGGKCFLHRAILQRSSVQRPEYCSLNRITAFRKVEIPFSKASPRRPCTRLATMAVTVLLELRFKPDEVAAGRELMGRALQDTRAFAGNLQTDVLVDEDDEAHWIIYELWDTVEHDEAYRRFRAGEGKLTQLPPLLAAPGVKTRYITADV